MKMVKSLLLGSAAGLVAIAGAQAADLPVKAKPVQYVKICSLYGAGFYYIPGTDTCLKIGGWVRREYALRRQRQHGARRVQRQREQPRHQQLDLARPRLHHGGCPQPDGLRHGALLHRRRRQHEQRWPRTAANTFSANRAFIQWAGFTFGLAQSFYDFYSTPATSYWGTVFPRLRHRRPGWQVVDAYTAQFGNGFSATISASKCAALPASSTDDGYRRRYDHAAFAGRLRRLQCAGRGRQPARRPGLGFGADHGRLSMRSTRYTTRLASTAAPSAIRETKAGWALGAGIKLNAPMIGRATTCGPGQLCRGRHQVRPGLAR